MKSDPRIYFAAERTLLAWIRTGLTVMGLGFVVARFGLFMRLFSGRGESYPHSLTVSTLIGVGMVIFGTLSIAIAAWQQSHFVMTLEAADKPTHYFIRWPIWFASALSIIGFVLALYIVFGSSAAAGAAG